MVHQNKSPYGVSRRRGFYFGCTLGGREQLRRRPPPAAETGSRSRGSGRRGQAPSQGAPADAGTATRKTAPQCRNQQSSGLLVSPRESPRGMGKEAERAGGRDVAAIQPYGKRRALFYCNNPECCDSLCTIGDENSCEGDRACGGSRERSQGQHGRIQCLQLFHICDIVKVVL